MQADLPAPSQLAEAEGCPPNWQARPLKDVADIRFSNVDKKTSSSELPVRLCNYTDVYFNDYITADMAFMRASATRSEIARFGLLSGDVIITKDSETPNDIGVPTLVDSSAPDLLCGYHLAMLRPLPGRVDPAFLTKQLAHNRILRYFGQQANGSTRYGLSTNAIECTPLWLPPIDEQREIGRIARLLDTAIERSEAVIAKCRKVRVGLATDLFNFGVQRDGTVRDPRLVPDQFKQSAAGAIPHSWKCFPLLDVTEWFSGGTPDRSNSGWWQGSIPFLTPKDMKQFELHDTIEHVTPIAARAGSRVMKPGTVYVVIRGMILAHTFPVCIGARPFAFNQDVKAVQGRGDLSDQYLAHWFKTNADQFLRRATEATHGTKKIDRNELARIHIAVPPPDEQADIVAVINRYDSELSAHAKARQKLLAIKAGLMDDLLSGSVRVLLSRATEEVS